MTRTLYDLVGASRPGTLTDRDDEEAVRMRRGAVLRAIPRTRGCAITMAEHLSADPARLDEDLHALKGRGLVYYRYAVPPGWRLTKLGRMWLGDRPA